MIWTMDTQYSFKASHRYAAMSTSIIHISLISKIPQNTDIKQIRENRQSTHEGLGQFRHLLHMPRYSEYVARAKQISLQPCSAAGGQLPMGVLAVEGGEQRLHRNEDLQQIHAAVGNDEQLALSTQTSQGSIEPTPG